MTPENVQNRKQVHKSFDAQTRNKIDNTNNCYNSHPQLANHFCPYPVDTALGMLPSAFPTQEPGNDS